MRRRGLSGNDPSLRRRALALATAAGCAVVFGLALADEPKEGPDAPKAEKRTSKDAQDAKGRGITVLLPGWIPPADPRSFPNGITVLGDPQAGDEDGGENGKPQVRIAVVPRSPVPLGPQQTAPQESEKGFDLVGQADKLQPDEEEPPQTIGPTAEEQLAAFVQGSRAAGSPVPEWIGWSPQDAFPERPSDEPYPWNPAKFDELREGVVWEPEHGFPRGDPTRPYPWQPVEWSELASWSVWHPSDAWGRQLGRSEVIVPWLEDKGEPPPAEDGEPSP
jgi:hypothetical protein